MKYSIKQNFSNILVVTIMPKDFVAKPCINYLSKETGNVGKYKVDCHNTFLYIKFSGCIVLYMRFLSVIICLASFCLCEVYKYWMTSFKC